MARTWEGLLAWGRKQGIDWFIGRRLPAMVSAVGLGSPQAKIDVQNICGTDRGALSSKLFFAEARERVLDAATAMLDDPNSWTQCWMMTATWAPKPSPTATHG